MSPLPASPLTAPELAPGVQGLFGLRAFRLHWAGVALSQVGACFTFVALPWLVLALPGADAFSVTTVLAAATLPAGVFMLFGGGLADRFSAYRTLLVSRGGFLLVVSLFAVTTFATVPSLWVVHVFALLLGTLSAVGTPASQALLPTFVPAARLGQANGLVMGTLQGAQVVGPVVAGWLVWAGQRWRDLEPVGSATAGIALAFAAEALAAANALALLVGMRLRASPPVRGDILRLVGEGLRFAWEDPGIRRVLGYLLAVSFFVHGPLLASLPLYTRFQLGLDERAYGTLYTLLGLGTVLGAGAAMLLRPSPARLGVVVLLCDFAIGTCVAALPHLPQLWLAGAALLVVGLGLGMVMVAGTTWFQLRTPGPFMGRVMSLVMFAVLGTVPISAALTGALVHRFGLGPVLTASGGTVVVLTAAGLALPGIRGMGTLPTRQPPSVGAAGPVAVLSPSLTDLD